MFDIDESFGCFTRRNGSGVCRRFIDCVCIVVMMTRHLTERWPCRTRGDVLAAAAAAPKMRADIRDGEGGTELCDEDCNRHDGIMPAAVAPAEDADILVLQVAENCRMPAFFLFLQMFLFHASHIRPVLPGSAARVGPGSIPTPKIGIDIISMSKEKEHNRNIFSRSSGRNPACRELRNKSRSR